MFEALNPSKSVVDKCTHALQEAILQGQLEPGSKLPPERQLAQDFGVNRVTVRTALSRLQASGLVSVRQGSGYRVRDYRAHGGMDLLGPVIAMARSGGQLESVVDDLLTVRRALAAAVLRRLSRGITPEDLRRVSKAIDGFGDAAERNASHQELAIADGQILIALLGATGSPVLGLCLNPILRVLADLPALSEAMYARPGENLVGWRLFEAWLAAPSSFPLDEIIGQLEKRDEHTLSRLRGLQ